MRERRDSGRKSRPSLGRALVLGILLTTGFGCTNSSQQGSEKTSEKKGANAPNSTTSVVQAHRTTLRVSVRQPGAIQAYEQTPIFSKLAGYVNKWHVDMGDRVRKGDLLVEIAVPEMVVELKQKDALLQMCDAEIKQAREASVAAEASLHSAEARIKEAQAGRSRAQAEHQRMKSQYDRMARVGQSGIIDKDSVAEARLGVDAAVAGLEEVEAKVQSAVANRAEFAAKLRKARADILVAEARALVAKENREQVKVQLDYSKLRSPFDGVVCRRQVDTGHFVQPAAGIQTAPLFVVERRDLLRISVEVPETDAGWVGRGNKAVIRIPALHGLEIGGEVARTSYSLDKTSRTLVAEIDLPNPNDQLRPGMYVVVTIAAEHADVLTLPTSAIITQGDVMQGYQSYCFMVNEGRAVKTMIEQGRRDAHRIEIVRYRQSGSTGDWTQFSGNESILSPAAGMVDGQSIHPESKTK